MNDMRFMINNIPSVLYGKPADKVYIFVHGKMGCKEEAAEFARDVQEKGYQVLAIDLPEHGERKEEADSFVPWKVVPELQRVMEYSKEHWSTIALRAESIGAYFSMLAYANEELEKKGVIPTEFGETLDWDYYQYAISNQITKWAMPTRILYAGKDNLVERQTVDEFSNRFGCSLTVMEDGEHWFHTPEQIKVLNKWTKDNI